MKIHLVESSVDKQPPRVTMDSTAKQTGADETPKDDGTAFDSAVDDSVNATSEESSNDAKDEK